MAPHTLFDLVSSEWKRPYSRELAAFPLVSYYLSSVYVQHERIKKLNSLKHCVQFTLLRPQKSLSRSLCHT